jgi:hypothetical protein
VNGLWHKLWLAACKNEWPANEWLTREEKTEDEERREREKERPATEPVTQQHANSVTYGAPYSDSRNADMKIDADPARA